MIFFLMSRELFETEVIWAKRLRALLAIRDESYLREVAGGVYEFSFRKCAMDGISDQVMLYDLAKIELDHDLRLYLVGRLMVRGYLLDLRHLYLKRRLSWDVIKLIDERLSQVSGVVSFIFDD